MLRYMVICALLVLGVNGHNSEDDDALQPEKKQLKMNITKEYDLSYLKWMLKKVSISEDLIKPWGQNASNNAIPCFACSLVMDYFIEHIKNGMKKRELSEMLVVICTLLRIESRRTCTGIIGLNVDILSHAIKTTAGMNGRRMCGFLSQGKLCPIDKLYDWIIEIPPGHTVPLPETNGKKSFNILHITDIHYDDVYTVGKVTQCGEPICCQFDQPIDPDKYTACGYWGSYKNADMPMRTIKETLKQTTSHDFDYVYFTGDVHSHRIWSTSIASNTERMKILYDKLTDYYKNIPVYPVLGNHESAPVDQYDIDGNDTAWLYKLSMEIWSRWLPVDEVRDTILRGGFYTVSPRKGLRVVALNSNVCQVLDWLLLEGGQDPYGQLRWLVEILEKAEKNEERVHILSHVPTGFSLCSSIWSREYSKIVERFANTIAAQFNGHTHFDEFYIHYNKSDKAQAINVAWNGAAVTTLTDSNPSYKLYQIDNAFEVVNFEEWTFNLTLANELPEVPPKWYKLYSFKEAYGVENMRPKELNNLLLRMATNHTLINQFHRYKFRNSDPSMEVGCNEDCQKEILCTLATTDTSSDEKCY